jgi:UDP-GlcNAc:undecaprenyl-phosphate/decaprenyl-phosphate GlcNAc-1-phosphate transferase
MPFLIALAIGVVATPVLAMMGSRLGLVDRPGALKIHQAATPVTGGIAVALAALLALALVGHGERWVAAAAVLALAGGLIDDARPSPPWVRIVIQAGAGALLVVGGLRLDPLGPLGGGALIVATIACCNAVNMLDGQDGLAGGLGGVAALGLAGASAIAGIAAALPLAVAGALFGFLVWNRPKARVFLGDGGAYAVGVLLAASAARLSVDGWSGLLSAGACLAVFILELLLTVGRRAASSASAVLGDRDHSYDRLARRSGSRAVSTLWLLALGSATSALGLVLIRISPLPALGLLAAAGSAVVVLDLRLLPASVPKGEP